MADLRHVEFLPEVVSWRTDLFGMIFLHIRPLLRFVVLLISKMASIHLAFVVSTRTPPAEAALIPVTTPSQPVLNMRTCTGQRLLLAG